MTVKQFRPSVAFMALILGLVTFGIVFIPIAKPMFMAHVALAVLCALLLIIIGESIASLFIPMPPARSAHTAPKSVSVIMAAFLPNEQFLILDTVNRLLARLAPDDRLILTYRNHTTLPVEAQLAALAVSHPAFSLLKVTDGAGKVDQLNAALRVVNTELVYLLDADGIADSNSFREIRSVQFDLFHVVQGRNLIRNTSHLLGKVVAVEFAAKYMVSLLARSHFASVAHFCGSNAVWLATTVQATGFKNTSLVEDVEASVRADLAGYRIRVDPSIGATELAPVTLIDWWRQRRRWAQGWLEIGFAHTSRIFVHSRFSNWKKLNWLYVIFGRRALYSLVSFWLIALAVQLEITGSGAGLQTLMALISLQMVAGTAQILAVFVQCRRLGESRIPISWLVAYLLLFPFYDLLKNAVTVAAMVHSISGQREWIVTPRPQLPA